MSRNLKTGFHIWAPMLICFWGLWIVHALDGQISLMMLALALALWTDRSGFTERFSFRLFFLILALSTKIFTLFPLVALNWKGSLKSLHRSAHSILIVGLGLGVLSLPALWNEPGHSPKSLVYHWAEAASSAGGSFQSEDIRGKRNPGLSGFALRMLDVPAENSKADVQAALIFSLIFGALWLTLARQVPPKPRWLGALALAPVVHPLPWLHLFVFSFPLAVYVVQEAFTGSSISRSRSWNLNRNILLKVLCLLGVFLICLSTEKLWGSYGLFLENNSAKSWGVLCLIASLFMGGS